MENAKNQDIGKIFQERFNELVGNSTQEEIAQKLNTSRQNVGNWKNGKSRPDIFALAEISKAYNVSTDYLLGLTDIKTTDTTEKDICEYTGLSEKSVNTLHNICIDEQNELSKTINSILVSENSINLFEQLNQLSNLSTNRRYHEKILNKMLDEHDKVLTELGINEQNYYEYLDDKEIYLTGSEEEIKRKTAVNFDRLLTKNIDEFISFNTNQFTMFPEHDIDFEILYDEPQMLIEYKATKFFQNIVEEIKNNTEDDKTKFVNYNKVIYQKFIEELKSRKDFLEKDKNDYLKTSKHNDEAVEEFNLRKQRNNSLLKSFIEEDRQEMLYIVEYLKKYEKEYLK